MANNGSVSKPKWGKALIIRFVKWLHFSFIIGAFVGCWMLFYHQHVRADIQGRFSILICGFYIILTAFFIQIYHAYEVRFTKVSENIYAQTLTNLLSGIIIYVLCSVAWATLENPLPLLGLLFVQWLLNILGMIVITNTFFHFRQSQKAVIIYSGKSKPVFYWIENRKYYRPQ